MASATKADDKEYVLSITREFAAPPALVFRAWSSPEHLNRWWGPEGYKLSYCRSDFREGGAWRLCMRNTNSGYEHWVSGVYKTIVPNKTLEFTYIGDIAKVLTLVTIAFSERDGKTLMQFRQAPFPDAESRDDHNQGWASTLNLLATYVRQLLLAGQAGENAGRQDGVASDLKAAAARHALERKPSSKA